jgi:crossover junction endodeoxyribonuclease RuvC
VEKIFFSKNVRTAFQVGEARGVVLLAAARAGILLFEYTPLQVKQAVAGYGRAEKAQVQKMVQMLLKLQQQPAIDDEADAMAVALCHLQNRRFQEAVRGGKLK